MDEDQDKHTQDAQPASTEQRPRLRTLSNGAVYDYELGRIVSTPGGGTAAITAETSQDMHRLRREQARKAILAGITEGTQAVTWRSGVRNMASAVATIASDPARGRAAVYAFEKLLQAADLWPKSGTDQAGSAQTLVVIGDQVAERLLAALSGRDNG